MVFSTFLRAEGGLGLPPVSPVLLLLCATMYRQPGAASRAAAVAVALLFPFSRECNAP